MLNWRLSMAVLVSLALFGSFGYARLHMPKYQFVAPHRGYLASVLAEYDLQVPVHSRLVTRIMDYLIPSVKACTYPPCNGFHSKQVGACPANINCINWTCAYTGGYRDYCVGIPTTPPCTACFNSQDYRCAP